MRATQLIAAAMLSTCRATLCIGGSEIYGNEESHVTSDFLAIESLVENMHKA